MAIGIHGEERAGHVPFLSSFAFLSSSSKLGRRTQINKGTSISNSTVAYHPAQPDEVVCVYGEEVPKKSFLAIGRACIKGRLAYQVDTGLCSGLDGLHLVGRSRF